MDIYNNIVELAGKKKMSLNDVEKKAGLGTGIISKWKKGNPTIDKLQKVADALEVSITRLLKK